MRREFLLPMSDRAFLDSAGYTWETINHLGCLWVLIHGFPIPSGYSCRQATAAVMISSSYPDAQLDMVFFHPALARLDGRKIDATCMQMIDGKEFQRWSRHYTSSNPWRPGIDDLSTHLVLVSHWLDRELKKK